MDYHLPKSLVNRCFVPFIGGRDRPVFFDIPRDYPPLDLVTRAYPAIRAEFEQFLTSNPQLPAYHEIDAGEAEISAGTPNQWNVCLLELLGHRLETNRGQFPQTCAVLDQVPHKIQAFFSILDPGKSIPLHEGPYFGYLRYHLALRVPSEAPPRLVINGQPYIWQEGDAVLFDDSWPHEVINPSHQMRAVLIIDVARPMPLLPTLLNKAAQLVARQTYGKHIASRARQFQIP